MIDTLGHKAASGAVWATIDRFGTMTIQFIVNLIMARLLIPADFGAIGMLAIFIAVSQTLVDGGFGSALIQKKEPTQVDFSTIFFWNICFSLFLYIILFITAPLVAKFYSMPILLNVLRCIGINVIITSIQSIQITRLRKQLAFRVIAITNLFAYTLGSIIAIWLAYENWGIWSLVAMQILISILTVVILFVITRWLPSLCFSKQSMKELFGFGGYIMAGNLLQTVCQNLQGIIIGKKFSATQMGYYSQAYKLDSVTSSSIPQVMVQVMYPVYSTLQEDRKKLNDMMSLSLRVISFIVYPILAVLILIAEPLIVFLYGEKWLPAVPYFRILCIGGFFVCLQNINFYAVAAVGKSRNLFNWSFYKWGFLLIALLIGMEFGMYGILWGMVLSSFNIFMTNVHLASRHTGIGIRRQINSILPVFTIVLISMLIALMVIKFQFNFIISGAVFLGCYFGISKIINIRAFQDTLHIIKKVAKSKN